MGQWECALELDQKRCVVAGSSSALRAAIKRGADLRIYTEFKYGEHIEPGSPNLEIVQEVSDFRVTYLVDDRWAAGIMNLRVPAVPPNGFGPRVSMSFFMYNEDGQQAIARPYFDGRPANNNKGPAPLDDHSDMPKYHQIDNWDIETNAPSSNFIYDFGIYRFIVRDNWREVFSHTADGTVTQGSLEELTRSVAHGCEVKIGVSEICADLTGQTDIMPHELFIQVGPCYYNTERKLFTVESQPIVRVTPSVPIRYQSNAWDFGWLLLRTDGTVFSWLCDPYTLAFRKSEGRYAIRWFIR